MIHRVQEIRHSGVYLRWKSKRTTEKQEKQGAVKQSLFANALEKTAAKAHVTSHSGKQTKMYRVIMRDGGDARFEIKKEHEEEEGEEEEEIKPGCRRIAIQRTHRAFPVPSDLAPKKMEQEGNLQSSSLTGIVASRTNAGACGGESV
ncbi:hypothetical protein M413DRAFT_191236 [Hebeloma cylindrosporum]|uniref:Uncharacterized protein n=1 Tax=Hebeloma cylindrosporum TaxID=76867 RepID=A0A0C2XP58_HEBCY|nr:hypothetical protein M413DRAFT_191236 [Hebeloma cylindrosporum h7]